MGNNVVCSSKTERFVAKTPLNQMTLIPYSSKAAFIQLYLGLGQIQ
jgi:hypothetical protein